MRNSVAASSFANGVRETPYECKPMAYRHLTTTLMRAPPFRNRKKTCMSATIEKAAWPIGACPEPSETKNEHS
jgi:hypothetical protein